MRQFELFLRIFVAVIFSVGNKSTSYREYNPDDKTITKIQSRTQFVMYFMFLTQMCFVQEINFFFFLRIGLLNDEEAFCRKM